MSAEGQLTHEFGCIWVAKMKIGVFGEWSLQDGNMEAVLQSPNPRLRQHLRNSGVKY